MTKKIEAGNAFVKVDADLNPIQKKLGQINSLFKGVGTSLSGIGKRISGFGGGLIGAGGAITAPILAATKAFTDFGDKVNKTSIRTGLSAESLTSLGFAAEQSGSSMGALADALFRSNRRIANAFTGTGPAVRALEELGLSAGELSQLDTESRFYALADALGRVQNEARRNQLAFEIFGDSFKSIQPLLKEGSTGIQALQREAKALGITLDDTDASNAAKLGDAFNRIGRSINGAFLKVGAAIAEPLIQSLSVITKITSAIAVWVDNNRGVVRTIAYIGGSLLAVGGVITAIGASFIGVGAAIASIGTIAGAAFGAVSTAIAVVTSPITLLVAALAGIGYFALESTGSLAKLSGMFANLGEVGGKAWEGIVSAVSSGNLQLAGEIAFTALEVGWLTITSKIKSVWDGVADFLHAVWLNAIEGIVTTSSNIYTSIATTFDRLGAALTNAFDVARTSILQYIDGIQTRIAGAIVKAQEFFGLFDAGQSAEIQATLTQDLKRRGAERVKGLNSRLEDRRERLEGRTLDRRKQAQDFAQTLSEDIGRRRRRIGSTPDPSTSRLKTLQEKLASLQTKALEEAKKTGGGDGGGPAQAAEVTRQAAISAISRGGSVGTFAAGVAGNIAGGAEQGILNATQRTADNTRAIKDQVTRLAEAATLQ